MADIFRPRFRYYVPTSQQDICNHFKFILRDDKVPFTGSALQYHIVVDYPKSNRHFWSPQMDLSLEKFEEGTLIRGLIGPRPNIWTVFMFFYAVAGISGLAGVIIGTVQWSMGESPWALSLIPFSALIFTTVLLLGKMGRKIAREESEKLHMFLLKNVHNPIELELSDL